jgi:hypothetical protein
MLEILLVYLRYPKRVICLVFIYLFVFFFHIKNQSTANSVYMEIEQQVSACYGHPQVPLQKHEHLSFIVHVFAEEPDGGHNRPKLVAQSPNKDI